MKSLLILVANLACSIGMRAQPLAIPKPMDVCELLRAPAKYNGKLVTIRGTYFEGGHGVYVRGERCDGTLVTNGHAWDSVIYLSSTEEEYERRGLKVERFATGMQALFEATRREGQRTGGAGRTAKITATYVGLFETRASFDGEVGKPHPLEGGFGPGAWAPGQLFIDSIKDIVVEFEASNH